MNKMKAILIFAAGVATGAILTHRFIKEKYEKKTREEVDSARAAYTEKDQKREKTKKELADLLEEIKNSGLLSLDDSPCVPDVEGSDDIYLIEEEEYGNNPDYEQISLMYMKDGVLMDEDGDMVNSPESFIGNIFYKRFMENEDSVYIRNDKIGADYEILRDLRTYEEVQNSRPHVRWRNDGKTG